MAEPPVYGLTPSRTPFGNNLTFPTSKPPNVGLAHDLNAEISSCLHDLRYLTDEITLQEKAIGTDRQYTVSDTIAFSTMHKALTHRLLRLKIQKSSLDMCTSDYHFEMCRIAALIYARIALPIAIRNDSIALNQKAQATDLLRKLESMQVSEEVNSTPDVFIWVLSIIGLISSDEKEEAWTAQHLAEKARAAGISTWVKMENRRKQICWTDRLNTPTCKKVWRRVESINAGYWAAQIHRFSTREASPDFVSWWRP